MKSKADSGDGAALYFRLTSNARCYNGNDYGSWLKDVGFKQVRVIRPKLSPGNVLTIGRR